MQLRNDYWIQATRYALDYYVAGRFAVAHTFNPVSANILHHAVELLLKACLSRADSDAAIRDYRNKYGHKLERLWQEFKSRQAVVLDGEFDSVIDALDHFEDIRYPDRLIREGAQISIGIYKVEKPAVRSTNTSVPYYELMLPEIDRLMALLFVAVGANPDAFLPRLLDDQQAIVNYEHVRATLLGRQVDETSRSAAAS